MRLWLQSLLYLKKKKSSISITCTHKVPDILVVLLVVVVAIKTKKKVASEFEK